MTFLLLADVTVVVHLAFVVFVVLGGLLVWRWPRVAWVHLPAALWGVWVELSDLTCPLTHLENWLRQQGGRPAYATGFIEHYLVPILYPAALSRPLQWGLAGIVLLVNATAYFRLLQRRAGRSGGR